MSGLGGEIRRSVPPLVTRPLRAATKGDGVRILTVTERGRSNNAAGRRKRMEAREMGWWSRRRRVTVALVLALAAQLVWPSVASPVDNTWTNSLNSNAKNITQNTASVSVVYPVVGTSYPGHPSTAYDDFCYAGNNHAYANGRCISGQGHSGDDIFPGHSSPASGDLRIVAAAQGTINTVACAAGAGTYVTVNGVDGHLYRYLHLRNGTTGYLTVGQTVKAGQFLGLMGDSSSCSSTGAGLHLHFDRWDGTNRSVNAKDPYRSLRAGYARPGLMPDGSTVDSALSSRWLVEVSGYSDYVTGVSSVGWPTRGSTHGSPNVQNATSSHGTCGYKQWLGNGAGTYDTHSHVLAALTRFCSSSSAFWVAPPIWGRWRAMGQESSYLGWPTSGPYPLASRQNFQGGCIYASGGTWNAAPWGTSPCLLN